MNHVDEQHLRAALDQRAERLDVPPPPVRSLLTGGRSMARARRVRVGIGVATGIVAIALGSAVLAQPGLLRSGDPVGPASPSSPPVQTPTLAAPQTVADLPRGAAPELPFIRGKTLYSQGATAPLGSGDALIKVGGGTFVTYRMGDRSDWSVHLLDPETGSESLLTESAAGPPVVSVDGRFAAWQVGGDGEARVAVWGVADEALVRTVTFPFTPTCCDNPFLLAGIDNQARVYGVGLRRTWVAGVDGGEPQVVRQLQGGYAAEVTADGLVVRIDRSSKEEPPALLVGRVGPGGTFTKTIEVAGHEASVSWDGSSIAYVDQDDAVRVRDLVSGDEQVMQLPEAGDVLGLIWEDSTAVLVEATTSDEADDRAWVRCLADSGRCELAAMLAPSAETARR